MSIDIPEKKDRKIALVIVDVQKKFTGGNITEKGCGEQIKTINEASSLFRESGRPVIFIYYDGPCHSSVYDGNDGDEYLQGILSDPRDITVHKVGMNSFRRTKLAEAVKECGCDSILLAGMVTQLCVMGTYYGAFEHRISPFLLKGGTIATADKFNDAAYVMCSTFTLEDIKENLRTTKVCGVTDTQGREYQRLETVDL